MAKPKKETRQIRVDPDVADMADELAPLLKLSAPDMLSRILRPILKSQLKKEMQRRVRELCDHDKEKKE